MCSLTIVKGKSGLIFTHNRDEDIVRHGNIDPIYYSNGQGYFAPKDKLAGGTWIGFNASMTAAILNGGHQIHDRNPPYRSSRGSIIHDLFEAKSIEDFLIKFNPVGLEPFTLVVASKDGSVVELVWNEIELQINRPSFETYLMYSSSTLYNDEIKISRKHCFEKSIKPNINPTVIWDFHNVYGEDHFCFINTKYNERIRSTCVFQVVFGQSTVRYVDLIDTRKPERSLAIIP
jgi:uncharacterized protein with NRDE domain